MRTKIWDFIKIISKFMISFIIIGSMIYFDKLDLSIVKEGFKSGKVILFSFAFISLGAGIAFYRWNLLLRGQNIVLGAFNTIRYSFIGLFFNTTMPGVVSGDIIKAWYVLQDLPKGHKKTPVLTAILLDRIIGLFGLIIVSSSVCLINWQAIWADKQLRAVGMFTMLLFAGTLFFLSYVMLSNWGPLRWLRSKMEKYKSNKIMGLFLKVYDAWMVYQRRPSILITSLVCSICSHTLIVSTVIVCSRSLGVDGLSIYQYFLIVPIGLLATALPIAPAGLGVGHAAFSALFQRAGNSLGAEIFTLFVTVQILVNLSGVIFYLRSSKPVESEMAFE